MNIFFGIGSRSDVISVAQPFLAVHLSNFIDRQT
jgi:hypothetical protein